MLRKHPRQEMAKAFLWMRKSEFQKLAELSGEMSLNVFLIQIIRKSLANELKDIVRKEKKDGVRGQDLRSEPPTTSTIALSTTTPDRGGPKSVDSTIS